MEIQEETKTELKPTFTVKKLGSGLIISIVLISLLAGAAAGVAGGIYAAQSGAFNHGITNIARSNGAVAENSSITEVVQQDSPAVVSIIISKDLNQYQQDFNNPFFFDPFFQFRNQPKNTTPQFQETGAGSGFFISSEGLILTNKHVVSDESAKYTVLTQDGKQYDAKVVATDPVNDLALVKVDIKNAPTLTFADSSKIEIGQQVIAIGNSLGQYANTVTTGIVSGIGRNIVAGGNNSSENLEGVIQTDAAINPGNSGGPLLNIYGEVIGVNTAIDQQGQLVGFAIPSNDALKAIQSYQKSGKIVQPLLGVRYVPINSSVKEQNDLPVDYGAWVISGLNNDGSDSPAVVPGSAADKAGIKERDIILSINGQRIDQDHTVAGIIKQFSPGDKLSIGILRDKNNITVTATLGQSK